VHKKFEGDLALEEKSRSVCEKVLKMSSLDNAREYFVLCVGESQKSYPPVLF
jgi:hypothetical protein